MIRSGSNRLKYPTISDDILLCLIKKCAAGEMDAQKKLYRNFGSKMMGLCLRYSRNREEAEEVLQDGFLLVFKNISQFRGEGNFEGWMRRIMINCALKRHRGRLAQIPFTSLTPESFLSVDSNDFTARLDEKDLLQLVQQLPPMYRLVFNLYALEGLKHKEIALLLNISEGTSKSNLFDARALLKKAIDGKKRYTKTQVYAKTGG